MELAGLQAFTLWALLALAVVNYARFRDVLYPPVIQATVWFLVLALYVTNQATFNALSADLYFLLLNGVFMFALGTYVMTCATTIRRGPKPFPPALTETAYSRLLFWVPLLGLPLFVGRAYALGHEGPTNFLLINIRHALLTEGLEEGYGPLQYLLPMSFVGCGLDLYRHLYTRNRVRLALSFTVAMTYAVLSTGRGFILLLLLMMAGIPMMARKTSTVRGFLYLLVIGCIALLFAGYLLQKGFSADTDLSGNVADMQQHIMTYVIGSLPAFDQYWELHQRVEYGANSLRSVLALADKIGLDVDVPRLIQEGVYVPVEFNVYTIYQTYFKDFSILGVIACQLLFGAWHGYLYKKADHGEPFHIVLYALFLFPLIMQFFQDQYLSLLSMWIQFVLLVAIQFYGTRLWARAPAVCQA